MVRTKNVAFAPQPSYDTVRFSGPRQAARYEYLEDRTVVQEKTIQFDDEDSDPIAEIFIERGWTKLCNLAPSYKAITLEFYANAQLPHANHTRREYYSYVRGKTVEYDAAAIQEVLGTNYQASEGCRYRRYFTDLRLETDIQQGLVDGPDCPYQAILDVIARPGEKFKPKLSNNNIPHKLKYSQLNEVASFWYRFSVYNILPVTNHSDVNVPRAVLLCSIMSGAQIDICQIIADNIYATVYLSPGNTSLA